MGTIKKTKARTYLAAAYDSKGRRHRKTFAKKSEAKAFISQIESLKHTQHLIGVDLSKPQIDFNEAIENFMITKSQLKKKTIDRYQYIFGILKGFLEQNNISYLDQFTPDHATSFYKELLYNYPDPRDTSKTIKPMPKTINIALQIIRSFFNYELEVGHIQRNPMLHLKNLRVEKPHPEFYTEAELENFFNQKMPDQYRYVFLALLHTGMRINELIHLTWDDIDLDRRLIYVRPRAQHKLKTDNAERAIPINDKLFEVIEKIASERKSNIYPFSSIRGKKLNDRRLLQVCKKIGAAAGIKGRVFLHKFRHTFATHLIKRRVPIEVIQKLLGHYSIQQSMVYLHIRSEDLHSDVAVLNDIVGQSKDEKT